MRRHEDRYSEAVEMVADAEALVQLAEASLAAARDPTMADVAMTQLQEADRLADEVAEAAAPAIEQRRQQLVRAGWEAIRSLQGEPGSSWDAKHRKFHSAATKAWLVRKFGRRVYEGKFPW